ncbi:hypothetical protein CLOP_g3298 [Closterium sp. NIES-67]|nr:hypothetical protein CLOP_g3298 [Closterium sp. NIES-67]
MAWLGTARHGMAWRGVAWCGMEWHCTWHGMASDARWGSHGSGARRALVIPGSDKGGSTPLTSIPPQ